MTRPAISATVITLNEVDKVKGCLDSVAWADDVLVLDSGSVDGTVELARSLGARVVHQEWLGYGRQKNRAAELAANDWVLNLDADERVTPALRDALLGAAFDVPGYSVVRRSDFLGRWHRPVHRPSVERLVRVYDRRVAAFTEAAVHEKVVSDAGAFVDLEGVLDHYGFRGVDDLVLRLNRYSSLLAAERPGAPSLLRMVSRPAARLAWGLLRHRGALDGRRGWAYVGLWAAHDLLVEVKRFERSLGPAGTARLPEEAGHR
ncbi:glycosyltransferase family 2 protein [Vallicoccus soli]|uniref:Glycosyltransferase family 2 protein n=1 Tax=Vallicoccus soli TaxID=2339232 RepID=A0A3A3Z428_9ACTN|nr:glycosyltransferase family 2 protein [Vallicoccus soli]RJK98182.1 glycosyltransferase family 2 protein [Vallicoccus soli]